MLFLVGFRDFSGDTLTGNGDSEMPANVISMAYVKRNEADIPWHGLGVALPEGESDYLQILEAAGMNHKVGLARTYIHLKDGTTLEVPKYRAIVRCDTKATLGMATTSYQVI